jgi:hypothetical protein
MQPGFWDIRSKEVHFFVREILDLAVSTVAQNVTRFDHDFWVSGFSSTKLFAFLVSLSSFDTQTQLWQGCTKSHPTPHSSTVKSFNSIHSVRNDRK